MTNHAFLTDDGFQFRDNAGRWLFQAPFLFSSWKNTDEFIDALFRHSRVVWLVTKVISEGVSDFIRLWSDRYIVTAPQDEDFYTVTRKSDGAKMIINSYSKLRDWGLLDYSPEEIERAIRKYQELLDMKFGYAKGVQGIFSLGNERVRIGGQDDSAFSIPPKTLDPFLPNVDDLYFFRDLTKEEKKKARLIAIDKNMAYPTACSIKVGLGDYDHCEYGHAPFDHHSPSLLNAGIYNITLGKHLEKPIGFYGRHILMPSILPKIRFREGWYDASVLRLLKDSGIPFRVHEAYIWRESSAVLDRWARKLREFANSLGDDDKLCRKLIKQTANATIGMFGHEGSRGKWYYRPDWRNAVISEHACRIYRDLLYVAEMGLYPCAIYVDCLYFAVNEDDLPTFPFLVDEKLCKKYKQAGIYDLRKAKKFFVNGRLDTGKLKGCVIG